MLWLNAFNLPEQEACLANQQMPLDAWCTTLKQVLYLFPFCEVNPPLQVPGQLRRSETNFTVLASNPDTCPGFNSELSSRFVHLTDVYHTPLSLASPHEKTPSNGRGRLKWPWTLKVAS